MKPWEKKKNQNPTNSLFINIHIYTCVCAHAYLFKLLNGLGNQMHTLPFSRGGFPSWDCPGAPGAPAGRRLRSPGAESGAGREEPARPGSACSGSELCWVPLRAFAPSFLGFLKFGWGLFLFLFFCWFGFVFSPFHSQQVLQQKAGIKSTRGRSVCPGILIFSLFIFFFLKTRKVNSKWLLEPAWVLFLACPKVV